MGPVGPLRSSAGTVVLKRGKAAPEGAIAVGTRVVLAEQDLPGTVFWVGASKHTDADRYGVKGEDAIKALLPS